MTVVHGKLQQTGQAGGQPHGAAVVITLVDQTGRPTAGFRAPDLELVGQAAPAVQPDGSWSVDLLPNGSIVAAAGDTLYRVEERVAAGAGAVYYISVPASGTPWVGDLRVSLPGQAPALITGYLPLAGGTLTGSLVLADGSQAASEDWVADNVPQGPVGPAGPAGPTGATGPAGAPAPVPYVRSAYVTSGDVTYPDTGGNWQVLPSFPTLQVPAVAGEHVELAVTCMLNPPGDALTDFAVLVDGVAVRYLSNGSAAPAFEGEVGLHPFPGTFRAPGVTKGWTVTPGDLDDGAVTVAVVTKSAGVGTIYASALWPWYWRLINFRTTL